MQSSFKVRMKLDFCFYYFFQGCKERVCLRSEGTLLGALLCMEYYLSFFTNFLNKKITKHNAKPTAIATTRS